MSYAKQTINNKSPLKRFSHGRRFDVAVDLIKRQQPDAVLDFGAGNGFLLIQLKDALPHSRLVGYDPIESMFKELTSTIKESQINNIEITSDLSTLGDQTFDVVSCQEVLEHFDVAHQLIHIQHLKRFLSNNGKLIVSVPLETGFSGLIKNLARLFTGQKHSNTSFNNVLRSVFGLSVKRKGDPYIHSHVGFNYKRLEHLFKQEDLIITEKKFSPFPILRQLLNSQVFYVLTKKEATN